MWGIGLMNDEHLRFMDVLLELYARLMSHIDSVICKHASWLQIAEIKIGILARHCLDWRIACREFL